MNVNEMGRVIICAPDPDEYDVERKPLSERWCFVCRKRRTFTDIMHFPKLGAEAAWYGPWAEVRCDVCGTVDGDCFPGTCRMYEE